MSKELESRKKKRKWHFIWYIFTSELLTDSKLDIAEEQDSLSPLMLRMNLLGGFWALPATPEKVKNRILVNLWNWQMKMINPLERRKKSVKSIQHVVSTYFILQKIRNNRLLKLLRNEHWQIDIFKKIFRENKGCYCFHETWGKYFVIIVIIEKYQSFLFLKSKKSIEKWFLKHNTLRKNYHITVFNFFSTYKNENCSKKVVKMLWVIFTLTYNIPETIFRPSKGAFGRLLLTFVLAAGVGDGFDPVLVWILEIE